MRTSRYQLAPWVPGLAALGTRDVRSLLGSVEDPPFERRADVVSTHPGSVLLRVPLPGTPDAEGRRGGPPKGAGTGHVYLRRYLRSPLREAFSARFTAPRSASLADREWNLLCALRAAGVTVPEPMAVGSEGVGLFDRRSFVVTRELVGFSPVLDWLAGPRSNGERRLTLRAVGLMLGRLWQSGVQLSELSVRQIYVGEEAHEAAPPGSACTPDGQPQTIRRLPDVAISVARRGRIVRGLDPSWLASMLRRLAAESAGALARREELRVLLFATVRLDRAARRAMVARFNPSDSGSRR